MISKLGRKAMIAPLLFVPVISHADGVANPQDAADVIVRGMLSQDADAIAALYAPNAVYLAPDSPMIIGREAIRGVYERHFQAGRSAIRFFDVEVDDTGDRALVVWRWTSEIAPERGEPMRMNGRSMVYMVKGDTGWQISADMLQTLQTLPTP